MASENRSSGRGGHGQRLEEGVARPYFMFGDSCVDLLGQHGSERGSRIQVPARRFDDPYGRNDLSGVHRDGCFAIPPGRRDFRRSSRGTQRSTVVRRRLFPLPGGPVSSVGYIPRSRFLRQTVLPKRDSHVERFACPRTINPSIKFRRMIVFLFPLREAPKAKGRSGKGRRSLPPCAIHAWPVCFSGTVFSLPPHRGSMFYSRSRIERISRSRCCARRGTSPGRN
jgi:hypothetical protein